MFKSIFFLVDLNLIDWSSQNILAVALFGTLYLWNASSGDIQQLLDMPSQDDYISSVSWLTEGNILAVGTSSAEVQLWDVSKQKRIRTMKSHSARIPSLSWNSYILSRYGVFLITIYNYYFNIIQNFKKSYTLTKLKWDSLFWQHISCRVWDKFCSWAWCTNQNWKTYLYKRTSVI